MADPSRERIERLDTPDEHVTFMRSQWPQFAAFAWGKYLSEGRGAVVIDLRNASMEGPILQVPTYYVVEGSERLRARGGWPNQDVAEAVQTYEPDLDVLFIFLRLDGDAFHYNVSDEPTPPRAYLRSESAGLKPLT